MFYFIIYFFLKNTLFASYIKSTAFPQPLSLEEEENFLNAHFNCDPVARDKLIQHNLRLVAHVAKKYESKYDDMEDLISIGTIGLIKAIDTYSNNKQTKLATYAARCINNEILMHLRTNKKKSLDISLNESVGKDKDGGDVVLQDIITAPQKEIKEIVHLNDNLDALSKYLGILTKREKDIITKRYGLFMQKELTQKEIAEQYNISRSYVSRIEKRALMKLLKEFIKAEKKL